MSRSSRALVVAAGLSAVVLTAACGSSDDTKAGSSSSASSSAGSQTTVVASTNVYGDIVRQIAGDSVKITSIVSDPDQDPHSYEANGSTQLALSKANLVIENGGGYDDFVDAMLKSGNQSAKVINVVDLSGKKAPAGGELNEHVWYDFPTVTKLADSIVQALSSTGADSAALQSGAATFKQKVGALEQQEAGIKQAHPGAGVAITEPVPLYMLEASGLVNKTPSEFSEAIEEGTDVSPAVLNNTLNLFREGKVKVLVYNEQTAGPETERVLAEAKKDSAGVVPVTETLPAGKDYLTWMSSNLQALSAALG